MVILHIVNKQTNVHIIIKSLANKFFSIDHIIKFKGCRKAMAHTHIEWKMRQIELSQLLDKHR